MNKLLLSTLFLFATISSANAVLFSDRGIHLNPLANPIDDDGGFFYSIMGWADFARYMVRSDDKHFWDARMAIDVEIYRFKNNWSIILSSHLELMSSSNSTINFEPRGLFWDETLMFIKRQNHFTWGVGYYHRCKHDIDNLNLIIRSGQYIARVLIWDSITLRFSPHPFDIQWRNKLFKSSINLHIQNHFYVIKTDAVSAEYGERGPTYTNLINTFEIGADMDIIRYKNFSFYVNPYFYLDAYRSGDTTIFPLDMNIEFGVRLKGAKNIGFAIFARYEKWYDNGIEPYLENGEYFLIGVKIQ